MSGATGWIRTNLLSLFRRALIRLSYSGEVVDLLGIEPSHDCLQGSGRQPIRTSPIGTRSRSCTLDIPFVRQALCWLS